MMQAWLELLTCCLSFTLAWYLNGGGESLELQPDTWWISLLFAGCFWWGLQSERRARGLNLLQPLMLGTGLVFLVNALLAYSGTSEPLPLRMIGVAEILSALSASVLRMRLGATGREKTLLVGCSPAGLEIARHLQADNALLGVLKKNGENLPPGVPYLGDIDQLENVLRAQNPTAVIVDLDDKDQQLPLRVMSDFKLNLGQMETAASAYQRIFERYHLPGFRMWDMLWTETQRGSRQVMALQAVYSNLVGLMLLLILSPVLLVVGVISWRAAGGRTMFERVECAGFQGIPFQRRRFRTRNALTGEKTWIGKWIERLRIRNLPKVVNLNRGDMGLFGPEPIRMEFSDYLDEVSPFHPHRLSVKPGFFGWAQANIRADGLPEEHVRMAYDFYYVEHSSLVMDIRILVQTLAGSRQDTQR